jgi:glycosyltransferase involved in cell wall biosynthesis
MAASLPVVASAVPAVTGVVRPGVTGLLHPPGDAPALARCLERLRADARLRRALGAAVRRHIERRCTWDHVARRILSLATAGRPVAA